MAANCVSLAGSAACPAFSSASISTAVLPGQFPFLVNVTDASSFDTGLEAFVSGPYVQSKYQTLFGCTSIDSSNTTELYARYTYSFICNAIVQNSIADCSLSADQSQPLCADACAQFALSEQRIVSSPELCDSDTDPLSQLRADFTNCALPANSLTGNCIQGHENEGNTCGFQGNQAGLCDFCSDSTTNSTDSCCVTANAESICQNVDLPVFTSMQPLFTTTVTAAPTSTPTGTSVPTGTIVPVADDSDGLSGGAIAGIVIGAVLGAAILLALIIFFCVVLRRRSSRDNENYLNQPSPPRSGGTMVQTSKPPPFEALPGARVTRMTALEGAPGINDGSPEGQTSSAWDTSPESQLEAGVGGGAAAIPKRQKTADGESDTPDTGEYSSPDGNTARSERMSIFKDYYSPEDIHTGDLVAVLWAYQPRAADEFELERGDMLKVVGLWDDGWATGVRVSQRADEWSPSRRGGRDSVVSNDSERNESADGDVKAFPLVCVCLPQHWRRTIEGEPSSPPGAD